MSCRYESFIFRAVVGLEGHLLCDMWTEVRRCRATGCRQGLRENQPLQMTSRHICHFCLLFSVCHSFSQHTCKPTNYHMHTFVYCASKRLQSASVAIATKLGSCWCFFWGNQGPRKQRFYRGWQKQGSKRDKRWNLPRMSTCAAAGEIFEILVNKGTFCEIDVSLKS